MATSAKNAAPDANAAPGGGKKKLIIIIAAVLLLLGGGGAWFFMMKKNQDHAVAEEEHEPPPAKTSTPVFLALDPFTLNLRGNGRFLQAAFTLQMKNEEESGKLKLYMPQLRSRMLLLLSSKTSEELGQVEGKNQLLTEIQQLLDEPMAPDMKPIKVLHVLITSFVIQ